MLNIVPQITADELNDALIAKENIVVLDVRNSGELLRGKIPGTLNVPLPEVSEKIQEVITNKKQ